MKVVLFKIAQNFYQNIWATFGKKNVYQEDKKPVTLDVLLWREREIFFIGSYPGEG